MAEQDLIYDVGMHNGDDTAYYLSRGFRVIAIEANPYFADLAHERFREESSSGRLTILNIGVTAEERDLPFWICETNTHWSSFHRDIASRDGCKHHAIAVTGRRFRSILNEFGVPYYLKVDIEGNDRLCLEDLDTHDLPKFISAEWSGEELALMAAKGYKRFKAISQFNFMPIELTPAAEGYPLGRSERQGIVEDWTFAPGSSGPFGEDLSGQWQSSNQLCSMLEHLEQLKADGQASPFWHDKNYSFWVDIHGRAD